MGLVHELGHVILGLLGLKSTSEELMLAALANIAAEAGVASISDASSPDELVAFAKKVRGLYGFADDLQYGSATLSPAFRDNLLGRAAKPGGSYENIFNTDRKFYKDIAGLDQAPSTYRVGYISHAGQGAPDPDLHWKTYGSGQSGDALGKLQTLIKDGKDERVRLWLLRYSNQALSARRPLYPSGAHQLNQLPI
jgi:hypothetical protein